MLNMSAASEEPTDGQLLWKQVLPVLYQSHPGEETTLPSLRSSRDHHHGRQAVRKDPQWP